MRQYIAFVSDAEPDNWQLLEPSGCYPGKLQFDLLGLGDRMREELDLSGPFGISFDEEDQQAREEEALCELMTAVRSR